MPVPPSSSSIAPIFAPVSPTELLSFTVLCRPASGIGLDEFRIRLAACDTDALLPRAKTLVAVAARLRELGFEVFDNLVFPDGRPGLAVFARGPVELFERVFRTTLARMTWRSIDDEKPVRELVSTGIVIAEDAAAPSLEPLGSDAILVSVAEPPMLAEPVATTVETAASTALCLTLSDVAHETHAHDVHQRSLFFRGRATGRGVRVAVVDTGFAMHPFFDAYHVTRIAGPYASGGGLGNEHGTQVLANLLVCAPGVDAWAVKYYSPDTAFATAMFIPRVRVISLSWGFPIGSDPRPASVVPLEYFVQTAINRGIAVVVASGYRTGETTPARLQGVIAVGGARVESPSPPTAWGNSSAFTSTIYGTRLVPDLCGIASQINMPVPEPPTGWACQWGSTSCAAPQVAAIAALLIQKNPMLSPQRVRHKLVSFATDIMSGSAYLGTPAGPGKDDATGGGLVNAVASWQHVIDAWWTLLWSWL